MLMTMVAEGREPLVIGFQYGQKHRIETEHARMIINYIRRQYDVNLSYLILDIPVLPGSTLTTEGEIPKEDYSVETQKATVVPNRNMVFLSIAAAYAIAAGAPEVWYAAHRNDQAVYRDCTPLFVKDMNLALQAGNDVAIKVIAPFIAMSKTEIVRIGASINMPFEKTWSCYDPQMIAGELLESGQGVPIRDGFGNQFDKFRWLHCGVCGTCRERKNAFKFSQIEDPTTYVE